MSMGFLAALAGSISICFPKTTSTIMTSNYIFYGTIILLQQYHVSLYLDDIDEMDKFRIFADAEGLLFWASLGLSFCGIIFSSSWILMSFFSQIVFSIVDELSKLILV